MKCFLPAITVSSKQISNDPTFVTQSVTVVSSQAAIYLSSSLIIHWPAQYQSAVCFLLSRHLLLLSTDWGTWMDTKLRRYFLLLRILFPLNVRFIECEFLCLGSCQTVLVLCIYLMGLENSFVDWPIYLFDTNHFIWRNRFQK